MTKRKDYTKEEIESARAIYNWLHENSAVGKTGRHREEVISRSSVKNPERFDRAVEYLKERKLLVLNHSGYMLIRESVTKDFLMPKSREQQPSGFMENLLLKIKFFINLKLL